MASIIYTYRSINSNDEVVVPSITVEYSISLVVLNNTYSTEGNVAASSGVFFQEKFSLNGGNSAVSSCPPGTDCGRLIDFPDCIDCGVIEPGKSSNQIRVDLIIDKENFMDNSDIFKSFWAKWSGKASKYIGSSNPPESGGNDFYFGFQILQKFEGNNSFAAFSKVDYVFVPYLTGKCSFDRGQNCDNPKFNFSDFQVGKVEVLILSFNKTSIQTKQVDAASLKYQYEQTLGNYQAQLLAQSLDLILSTEDYQPTNLVNVVTRLLEYQEATLIPALDFTLNAGLDDAYSLFSLINTEIEDVNGLYPSITIEDGEGFPYGDGVPGLYLTFGWARNPDLNGQNYYSDIFAIKNKDESSVTNYLIITLNGVQILDTRNECGLSSLSGRDYVWPNDCISWGFNDGDILVGLVNLTDYVGPDISFVHSDYGSEEDAISSGVTLTRGLNGGLYNSNVESGWDDQLSPSGTTWNSQYNADGGDYGWANLDTVDGRNFGTFYNALDGSIGANIVGLELVMHDEITDEYWAFKFTGWTQGQGNQTQGGGFAYTRKLINQSGTVLSYSDTMVWKD
jgi:hypothetical protein